MDTSERRGFLHFLYINACGHVEAVISKALTARVETLDHNFKWGDFPLRPQEYNPSPSATERELLRETLLRILCKLMEAIDLAPFGALNTIHKQVFGCSVMDVLGSELYNDILGLVALRNLFAHGREFWLHYSANEPQTMGDLALDISFDGHPLKAAANALQRRGLIDASFVGLRYYQDVAEIFYSDQAVLIFYEAAQSVWKQYSSYSLFPGEELARMVGNLPNLA